MSGFLIVGAGQAGASLAAKLRALGYDGELTLIGEEPAPPYQRPPLSKGYLLGEMELDRLFSARLRSGRNRKSRCASAHSSPRSTGRGKPSGLVTKPFPMTSSR